MPSQDIVRTPTCDWPLPLALNREKLFADGAATHGANGLEIVEDGQTLRFDLLKEIHCPS